MILIDTGPLVALCDARDSLNKTAVRHLKNLVRFPLVVCEPVLTEAAFHLPAPSQRMRLQQMIERLNMLPPAVDDPHSLWSDVFGWLAKYSDHDPDWTDGYLAALCTRNRKFKVWTYDAEFRSTWRRADGSAIPLAIRI
jgi:predicted nucleic acid-binding protein